MSAVILAIGILLIILAVILIIADRIRTQRTLDTIEDMLHQAMKGDFQAGGYEESRLSKLESKLSEYLSSSSISAQHIADEKDKLKTIISDISHQTKTPIANLLLYSELLESTDLTTEQKENALAIHAQAEKLRFLIDSLIKLSRLESGIISLDKQKTAVLPILKEIVLSLKEKSERKGIELRLDDADALADIDPRWTQEAIFNIADNAVKYTDKGNVRLRILEYDMFVRVDIEDTGIGISEEDQTKVFGRFYRSRDVKEQEGAGIGLYLARQIITGEGGYIKVSSDGKSGTTFSVFLPR
ncbi:MAG: HAMP domain-containing histidine kinase [Lachnospiraceae bacterium]|nr:HAMP domain-containing histidine kinase [Lachnospiraceae bacterium]